MNGFDTGVYVDYNGSGIITLTNSGVIGSIADGVYGIIANRQIYTLLNSPTGVISGSTAGLGVWSQGGTYEEQLGVGTLENNGIIQGGSVGIGTYYQSFISTINNYGQITGGSTDISVCSTCGIETINNGQGSDSSGGALDYNGILPTYYNVIINSTTSYGQFRVTNASGQMTFGISALSGSTIPSGTYTGVLQGFSTLTNVTPTTGTFNGYPWRLVADSVIAGQWNLVYDAPPTITSLNPATGISTGGTSVVIVGTGFAGATSVTFGGTAASSYVVNSQEKITATAPAHAAGTADVEVVTPNGTATSANAFTYSQATINGLCGTANGVYYTTTPSTSDLCLAGTASTVTQSAPLYTWSCAGLGGGTTANCSTSKATQATFTISTNLKIIKSGRGAILSTKGGSGTGKLRYSVVASGGASCTIKSFSGKILMKSGAKSGGICTVSATKAGDDTYNAATASPLPITVK
jgi:hypothetical protein